MNRETLDKEGDDDDGARSAVLPSFWSSLAAKLGWPRPRQRPPFPRSESDAPRSEFSSLRSPSRSIASRKLLFV